MWKPVLKEAPRVPAGSERVRTLYTYVPLCLFDHLLESDVWTGNLVLVLGIGIGLDRFHDRLSTLGVLGIEWLNVDGADREHLGFVIIVVCGCLVLLARSE